LAEVAQLYYAEDFTQEQIARRIGGSRSNVSRMLKEARARGLVEIRIRSPLGTIPELQEALRERTGLAECLVLSTSGRGARASESGSIAGKIGALAARYMQESISDGNIVGVGWSSTVYHHVVSSGYLREKRGVAVCQLMGSVGDSIPELNGMHIAARLAAALGASAHYLHAPMLVADSAVRDALMRDQSIRKTLSVARRADVTVVGVGAVDRDSGQYRTGYLNDSDLEYIRGRGAVGEVCGSYFLRDGSFCPVEMNERTIALDFESMVRVPTRIGVSWGVKKALANVSVARSGVVNVLITDEDTAREMLRLAEDDAPAPAVGRPA
jgi:DNA-binding transcriptional regulator LsrR (DeoR family)